MLFFPFFGITDWMRVVLGIAIGIVLIYLAFALRHEYKRMKLKLRQEQAAPPADTVTSHG
ncbi:MAG TPA: hypothetical protein VG621_02865 [Candidatus Paceibacterota bacterium]|nr:hypothetical protein [Candidatus Paceibacterota bacterium]